MFFLNFLFSSFILYYYSFCKRIEIYWARDQTKTRSASRLVPVHWKKRRRTKTKNGFRPCYGTKKGFINLQRIRNPFLVWWHARNSFLVSYDAFFPMYHPQSQTVSFRLSLSLCLILSLYSYRQAENNHCMISGYNRNEKNMERLIAWKYNIKNPVKLINKTQWTNGVR